MNIQKISKADKEVTLTLDATELVKLCNVLYHAQEEDKNNTYYNLYSDMIIARDLCQYWHLDTFSFDHIKECRDNIQDKKK